MSVAKTAGLFAATAVAEILGRYPAYLWLGVSRKTTV